MHTVIELPEFIRCSKKLNLTDQERENIIDFISSKPDAGVEISGTGGMRKLRIARENKGKSGGYRIITFFSGINIPVFLVSIYGKNQKENITDSEKNILKSFSQNIIKIYGARK